MYYKDYLYYYRIHYPIRDYDRPFWKFQFDNDCFDMKIIFVQWSEVFWYLLMNISQDKYDTDSVCYLFDRLFLFYCYCLIYFTIQMKFIFIVIIINLFFLISSSSIIQNCICCAITGFNYCCYFGGYR